MPRGASIVAALLAACAATAPPSGDETRARAAFARRVQVLASAEFEGRAAGTAGGLRARRFVAAELERIGVQPLESLGGWEHEFEIPSPRAPVADPRRTRIEPAAGGAAILGEDFAPFGFSAEGEVEADCVWVGHGIVAPELGIDDYEGVDAAGRIALVLRGGPGWRVAGSAWRTAHRDAVRFARKVEHARRAGVVAVLLVDDLDGSAAPLRRAATARGAAGIPALWVSRGFADRLLGGDGVRVAQRGAAGARVRVAVGFAERPAPVRTANVVGMVRGAGRPHELVVVGAHWDHLGDGRIGDAAPEHLGVVHPGADDNASGVAALLAVAEELVASPPPRRSVVLVSFGAEELGSAGSRALLEDGALDPAAVVAFVNLEMIGRCESAGLRIEGVASGVGLDRLAERAAGSEAECRADASPRSDHQSFMDRGIPSVVLHSGVHDDYHRPSDVPERVEIAGGVRAARVAGRLVRELAEGPRIAFRRGAAREPDAEGEL